MITFSVKCIDCGLEFRSPITDEEISEHYQTHIPDGFEVSLKDECPHCHKDIGNE